MYIVTDYSELEERISPESLARFRMFFATMDPVRERDFLAALEVMPLTIEDDRYFIAIRDEDDFNVLKEKLLGMSP